MQEAKWHEWNSFEGQTKPVSHGDLIRAKNDEQLAEWLWMRGCPTAEINDACAMNRMEEKSCIQCWLEWLQKEADHA